jgi:hypothetical protein
MNTVSIRKNEWRSLLKPHNASNFLLFFLLTCQRRRKGKEGRKEGRKEAREGLKDGRDKVKGRRRCGTKSKPFERRGEILRGLSREDF